MRRLMFCPLAYRMARLGRPRRPPAIRAVAVILAVLGLAGCAGVTEPQTADLQRTWERAWVIVPAEDGAAFHRMGDGALARWWQTHPGPWPTVLYLHGCTGLGNRDRDFLGDIARRDIIVIAPDSMARRWRPLQCNPHRKTGGYNLFVYDLRQAEINYALERMRHLSWVDPESLLLFGASEGGVAAALYRGDAFNGRIITHWTCHGGPLVRGLEAPDDEAVLAVVQAADPWYDSARTSGQDGNCGAFAGNRPNLKSIVLNGGRKHAIFDDPGARKAILDFVEKYANIVP